MGKLKTIKIKPLIDVFCKIYKQYRSDHIGDDLQSMKSSQDFVYYPDWNYYEIPLNYDKSHSRKTFVVIHFDLIFDKVCEFFEKYECDYFNAKYDDISEKLKSINNNAKIQCDLAKIIEYGCLITLARYEGDVINDYVHYEEIKL